MGGPSGWIDLYGMMSLNKLRFFRPEVRDSILAYSAYDDLELTPNLHRWHPFHRQTYLGSRVILPGHLLSSKGDRVAMHSSVETRYAFLDEEVLEFTSKLHPRWKLRGLLRDKFIERKVAERWLPKDIAWRRKHMFRAPMDSWIKQSAVKGEGAGRADAWVGQVLSEESVRKAGYFDPAAVTAARQRLATMRQGIGRTGLEMGLTAVTATQLWHHLYISGDLADIPSANVRSADVGTRGATSEPNAVTAQG
jgi:asparagine synthase (glutamine-hydrolysing)